MEKEKNTPKYYFIPFNFADQGYILNGMLAKRNAFDGLILAFVGLVIAHMIPAKSTSKISVYILFCGFFGMIGAYGYKGLPISTYLKDIAKWRKRRKPYLYNSHSGIYTVSAADVMLAQPQLRDALADAIDLVKDSMKKDLPEYIEGQNFEFMKDPELEALKAAMESNSDEDQPQDEVTKPLSDSKRKSDDSAKQNPSTSAPLSCKIDISNIMDNIKLDDVQHKSQKN